MRPSKPLLGAVLASFACACACASGQSEAPPSSAAEPPPASETAAPEAPAQASSADAPTPPAEEAAPAGGDPDTRTMEVIAGVVKAHRKDARACYEKAQKQITGLKGDIVVHFVLTPSGKVKTAELNEERSTIKEPSVVNCVIDVIRAIEFPKSSRGMETTVNYPFNFTP
jgi:hypothetical protein